LDSKYIGEIIGLKYKIDVVTGIGVAILYHLNKPFETLDCNPSKPLIYTLRSSDSTIGDIVDNVDIEKGTEPYIKVKWYPTEDETRVTSNAVRSLISDLNGYVELSDMDTTNLPE